MIFLPSLAEEALTASLGTFCFAGEGGTKRAGEGESKKMIKMLILKSYKWTKTSDKKFILESIYKEFPTFSVGKCFCFDVFF